MSCGKVELNGKVGLKNGSTSGNLWAQLPVKITDRHIYLSKLFFFGLLVIFLSLINRQIEVSL